MFSVSILLSVPSDNTSINCSSISTVDRFFIVFSVWTSMYFSDKSFSCGLGFLISFLYFVSKVFNFLSTLDFIFSTFLILSSFFYLLPSLHVLSKAIDYRILTENIPVIDTIAGTEDAIKTLPTINTSNAFPFDCCNILKKSRNKSEINISAEVCGNINKWVNNNDLCLLEADEGGATFIISRREVHKMVEQEFKKLERYGNFEQIPLNNEKLL